jgi:hypothetical protein
MTFFTELEKRIPKFIRINKRFSITKAILSKREMLEISKYQFNSILKSHGRAGM